MQFEPTTFAAYATVGPGGVQPPTPYDPVDAVCSSKRAHARNHVLLAIVHHRVGPEPHFAT